MTKIPRSLHVSPLKMKIVASAFVRKNLTQEEAAKKLEISRSTLSNYLSGKPVLRSNFSKICNFFNLDPETVSASPQNLLPPLQPYKESGPIIKSTVSLNQWFSEVFSDGWGTCGDILGRGSKFSALRNLGESENDAVRRAKLIALDLNHESNPFALVTCLYRG
ncbi:putative transcriptional regulator [Leptolyngbya sp. PCC 7375]|nr:putative transcriptional regulator [Leptolyngbya sp. PCC 7375]